MMVANTLPPAQNGVDQQAGTTNGNGHGRAPVNATTAAAAAASAGASDGGEVELMRVILGEQVPQAVILACLSACGFDVTAALNWYFMELASHEEDQTEVSRRGAASDVNDEEAATAAAATGSSIVPVIQSGHSLTLHSRAFSGMISKTDSYYATLTRGLPTYDMITPSNEKFLTIRLRKRGWRAGHLVTTHGSGRSLFGATPALTKPKQSAAPPVATERATFMNGDVVTLECNGLWLRGNSLNKMLQWKSPSDDDRCMFVIRGLPLGRNLRPGDYFFLTSHRWGDKEIVIHREKPVGLTSYNTSVHSGFLALERVKDPAQRLFLYARLTENAIASLPKPDDPIDLRHFTIDVGETPTDSKPTDRQRRDSSISDEISLMDAKIDQMVAIVGEAVSRDRMANCLDGAGGDVQVALEHYFMTLSEIETTPPADTDTTAAVPPAPIVPLVAPTSPSVASTTTEASIPASPRVNVPLVDPIEQVQAHAAQVQQNMRRPVSDLILPIPSMGVESSLSMDPSSPGSTYDSSSSASSFSQASSQSRIPFQQSRPPTTSFEDVVNAALEDPMLSSYRSRNDTASASLENSSYSTYSQYEEQESLTIHDFEMVSVLGRGSFGAVMLVRFKMDGRLFALKIIKKNNMDRADIRNAVEERQILQRINHPYICSLVFAFQTNERLYLGMKYYAAGDLFYHLNMRGRMRVRDAQLYAAELVLAISYLHELNILYRDLKPSNVMIDSEGHIGVVDFGLSKQHIYGSNHGVKTLSGTAEYVAPEALTQMEDGSRSYGKAYDWWSLGIVLYEMLAGESPFYDKNEHKMLRKIAFADVVFPSDFPRQARDLVSGLLCKDPSKRLGSERLGGVEAIQENRFFRGMDWDKLARREVPAHWKPSLTSDTDTRYVDPEFIEEGPPSATIDPSIGAKKSFSKRFSQFSFNIDLS